MIKFSIITVTYNAEACIEVTLKSVKQQSYPLVEHIIVDGGSKDQTLAIVDRYKSEQMRVISEPDKGLYDAMNKGIGLATGDYLCFLNAGDTFHELATLEKIIKHTPPAQSATPSNLEGEVKERKKLPDIIYGETAIVDGNRQFLRKRRLQAPEQLNWKSFKQGMLVCHQAFFIKHSLAEPYDLQYRYSSDFDWCIRMMKKADVIHNTHLILIDYLEEGMTTRNRRASLFERLHIMAKHYGWLSTVAMHLWFVIRLLIKR